MVEVDLRVFDGDGRFITDLRPDEIEILEDGVPQRVIALQLVDPPTTSEAIPTTSKAAPTTSEAVPTTRGGPPPQTWIFFFDLNHLTAGTGFDRARKAAADFARERFREGDIAGVVAGNRMVNNRLSSVRSELVAAIEGVKPNTETRTRDIELTRQWPRFLDAAEALEVARNNKEVIDRIAMRACNEDPGRCEIAGVIDLEIGRSEAQNKAARLAPQIQRSTRETFSAINVLANGLARMPGPKTIVLLSDGFVTADMETSLRSLVGQVARAGARLYAIDTRGLNRRGSGIIDQAQATDTGGPVVQFDGLEDGPNSLAVDTGGFVIRNENNIDRALGEIAADANRYYVLGYEPSNMAFDGKYRSIEVRVKRSGVRVRARKGYLALEPAKMLTPKPIATVPAPVPAPTPAMSADTAPVASIVADRAAAADLPAPGDTVRMRPDAAERVRELSDSGAGAGAAGAGAADSGAAEDEARRAWDAYQRGDLETAVPLFESAAARPGVRPWALYAMGLAQNGLGRAREAVASWERVRAAAPDYAPVYMDLAATYGALGELTQALAVLREAEKRWPADPDVHNGIGVILVRRGALDQAIEAFQKAVTAAPDQALTHLNLGRAYELRYMREMRYVSSQRRWVSREEDRKKAAESYERCVAIGGPYALPAKQALSRLQWK